MIPYPGSVEKVGKCSNQSAVTVNTTPQEITLTAGKKTIELVASPDNNADIFYGGSGVNSNTGAPLYNGKVFRDCKANFSVYVVVAAGTQNLRVIEYD